MQQTKSIEYLLVIVFLVGFALFWRLLEQNEDQER